MHGAPLDRQRCVAECYSPTQTPWPLPRASHLLSWACGSTASEATPTLSSTRRQGQAFHMSKRRRTCSHMTHAAPADVHSSLRADHPALLPRWYDKEALNRSFTS